MEPTTQNQNLQQAPQQQQTQPSQQVPPPSGHSKKPLFILMLVAFFLISGFVVLMMLMRQNESTDSRTEAKIRPTAAPSPTASVTLTPEEKEVESIDVAEPTGNEFSPIEKDLNSL